MNNLIMYNNYKINDNNIKNNNKIINDNNLNNECKFTFYIPNFKLLYKRLFCR